MGKCFSRPERHSTLPKRLYPASTPDNEQASMYSHPNIMLQSNKSPRITTPCAKATTSTKQAARKRHPRHRNRETRQTKRNLKDIRERLENARGRCNVAKDEAASCEKEVTNLFRGMNGRRGLATVQAEKGFRDGKPEDV
ncbi:hypothetical protein FVEG_16050 [Fusarium verticillioides 7600]|uniref:Uncharacterized protein n=1 Tax=Gibberella moniliformis (strain M3125 / FGSC 7600) TaxID=334819 RepID=W7MHD6_GIBM7|nr:hypothetical protein FVEG_16050 [Fusarium verticillioides 7600]EWG46994.1 hypothetical protein FVEG_16050 [Fusarium verticillioides 7600]